MKTDLGHWEYYNKFNPKDYFGFVYEIKELDTGMKYIGKTTFWHIEKKKPTKYVLNEDGSYKKDSKGKRILNKRTTKKHIKKETNWRTYTSSNVPLAKKIEKKKSNYRFIILYLGTSNMDVKIKEAGVQIDFYRSGRWNELYNEQIDIRGRVPK